MEDDEKHDLVFPRTARPFREDLAATMAAIQKKHAEVLVGSLSGGPPAALKAWSDRTTAVREALEVLGFRFEGVMVLDSFVTFSTRRFTLAQIDLLAEVFGTRRIDFADGPYSFATGGLVDIVVHDPQLPEEHA